MYFPLPAALEEGKRESATAERKDGVFHSGLFLARN